MTQRQNTDSSNEQSRKSSGSFLKSNWLFYVFGFLALVVLLAIAGCGGSDEPKPFKPDKSSVTKPTMTVETSNGATSPCWPMSFPNAYNFLAVADWAHTRGLLFLLTEKRATADYRKALKLARNQQRTNWLRIDKALVVKIGHLKVHYQRALERLNHFISNVISAGHANGISVSISATQLKQILIEWANADSAVYRNEISFKTRTDETVYGLALSKLLSLTLCGKDVEAPSSVANEEPGK